MKVVHVCCAPDFLSAVLKRPQTKGDLFYFYNPNIYPLEEYEKRLRAFELSAERFKVSYLVGGYDRDEFSRISSEYRAQGEGGRRCGECIELRLKKTVELCEKYAISHFTTTLLASPRKSLESIGAAGRRAVREGIEYVQDNLRVNRSDLKPHLRGVYLQDYCGCRASLDGARSHKEERDRRDFQSLKENFPDLRLLWEWRGKIIKREQIPLREIGKVKDFLAVLKPHALLVESEDELGEKNWLKTGKYNCRIFRETDGRGDISQ